MSHLTPIRPSGQWLNETVPGAQDFWLFDDHQYRLLDGTTGGTWNPTSPIIIGGQGVVSSSATSSISGGVTTATGGRVKVANFSGNTPGILLSAPSDTLIVSMEDMGTAAADYSGTTLLQDDYTAITSYGDPGRVGVQSIANPGSGLAAGIVAIPGRSLHDGASFTRVTLTFSVLTRPPPGAFTPPLLFIYLFGGPIGGGQTFAGPTLVADWLATTAYPLNSYVLPTTANINGFYFKAITGGTSGGSEPVWPSVVGNTVSDGSVLWICVGQSGWLSQQLSVGDFYNGGQPQALHMDLDPANMAANLVQVGTWPYEVLIGFPADASLSTPYVNMRFHSLKIEMGNIVDMRFE